MPYGADRLCRAILMRMLLLPQTSAKSATNVEQAFMTMAAGKAHDVGHAWTMHSW